MPHPVRVREHCAERTYELKDVEQLPNAYPGHGIGFGIIKPHPLRLLSLSAHR